MPLGGRIDLRCRAEGDVAWFEVQDTARGIPREDMARVFERFYQVDKSRGDHAGGTGLGLAIVKHAVQALGGDVTLSSAIGQGTTVSFSIPLQSRRAD